VIVSRSDPAARHMTRILRGPAISFNKLLTGFRKED